MRARSHSEPPAILILSPHSEAKLGTILVPQIFKGLIFWIRYASPGRVQWALKSKSEWALTWASVQTPIGGPNGNPYGSPNGSPDGGPDGDPDGSPNSSPNIAQINTQMEAELEA